VKHATIRTVIVPALVSTLLVACGDKQDVAGSAAASGSAAAPGKTALTGVYKVSELKRNEAACEEAGATAAEPARKHLYLAATGAGRTQTWGAVSCDDPAGCTKDITEYEKGASGEREVYELFGRETERNKLTGGTNFSGKWKEGQCSGLQKSEATLALDGKKLTITVRKLTYDNFSTGELSGCTVIDAEKQKVQSRCTSFEKLQAERVE
jgi:hypothetical protein